MSLSRMFVAIPVLFTGISFTPSHSTKADATALSMERKLSSVPERPSAGLGVPGSARPLDREAAVLQTNFVLQRKARIARVLLALDRVAQATLQLKPDTASRIEPVVVDLAEQAVDLSSDEALHSTDTDATLSKIEDTVSHLVRTMGRLVEPEMSL